MSRAEVIRVATQAAKTLAPVVVGLGPTHPRLSSYAGGISRDGAGTWLELSPIAADAIIGELAPRIRVTFGGELEATSLVVSVIEPMGPSAARVRLDDAVIAKIKPRRGARADARREPLVLVVPGSSDELDAHVFPVRDIGSGGCAVDTTVPLEPGRTFEQVDLVLDRRIVRRARASVLEAIPWRDADGTRRFVCRLSLDRPEHERSRQYDLVSDPERVQHLLASACSLDIIGRYQSDAWGRGEVRFQASHSDHLELRLETPPEADLPAPTVVRIEVELFAVSYEIDVRLLRRRGATIDVALPLCVRRRRRRHEPRTAADAAGQLAVSFHNPITGRTETRPVIDLSFGGICFDARPEDDVLWAGLVLERCRLLWRGERAHLGNVEIRALERAGDSLRCHGAARDPHILEDRRFIDILATLRHPNMRLHDGTDFPAMVDMYRRVGLFGAHMERNLAASMPEASRAWRALHSKAPDVCRTLIQMEDDEPVASVSAIRAWERSWVIQHMGALPSRRLRAPGALHMAYLDHVLARPDCNYMVVFVKADNAPVASFVEGFLGAAGTPEAISRQTVELWSLPPSSGPKRRARAKARSGDDVRIRTMRKTDERLVARAAERRYGPLAAAALSLCEGELSLTDTRTRYRRARLLRARRNAIVSRNGVPILALVEELASPGVNLTWMLNATWILPIHPELDTDGAAMRAAVAHARSEGEPTAAGDRFIVVPEGFGRERLTEGGYVLEAPVHMHAYNRAGLHRWYFYVYERYGEIAVRRARTESELPARTADAT